MMANFKIGQKVKINPVSEAQKDYYPWGWVDDMNNYVGQIATISGYVTEQYPDYNRYQKCYTVKENDWTWSHMNLQRYEKE